MAIPITDGDSSRPNPLRVLTGRRSLPNSRALIGALLVTLAALGAFAATQRGTDGPVTHYLVSTSAISVGESVSLTSVEAQLMTLSPQLAATALNSTEGLQGATALRDIRPGELLTTADFSAAPMLDGTAMGQIHEISFGIPLDRTPPTLLAGDRVTILATIADTTSLAVEDAVVLAIDTTPDQLGSSGRGVLTLGVDDPAVVMEIAHLTQVADITIVRSTRALDDVFPATVSTKLEPVR